MPPINIYYHNTDHEPQLEATVDPLRDYVANQLSCGEIPLTREEVSVRMIKTLGSGMLAEVEMDIAAAPVPERVEKQDEICSNVREFMLAQVPELSDTKVWLNLHKLGYSFDR